MSGLGILCPGQGAQHAGMLALLDAEPAALAVLAQAEAVLGAAPAALAAGPELFTNAVAQPLICAAGLATWAALAPKLPPVSVFAGYSVGELTAWACAGALPAATLIHLASLRAAAMDAACREPTGLLAVRGLDRPQIEALCSAHGCAPAIVNDHDRLVVGGPRAALPGFEAAALALGAQLTPLAVPLASHTPWLAAAVPQFAQALAASAPGTPSAPVLAGIDGSAGFSGTDALRTLPAQIAQTVDWAACTDALVERGCTVLLELGPGSGLSRMARDRHPELAARSAADFRSLDGAAGWVARMLG
ncbi:MAG: acyltransferase domain-containing protein [Lysobacterales bacterium]|nr:MAG: acyltransferase domain-containing protein [Xanthomonadales bacterium]